MTSNNNAIIITEAQRLSVDCNNSIMDVKAVFNGQTTAHVILTLRKSDLRMHRQTSSLELNAFARAENSIAASSCTPKIISNNDGNAALTTGTKVRGHNPYTSCTYDEEKCFKNVHVMLGRLLVISRYLVNRAYLAAREHPRLFQSQPEYRSRLSYRKGIAKLNAGKQNRSAHS